MSPSLIRSFGACALQSGSPKPVRTVGIPFSASAATIGSSMLVVDAIHERAAAFYEANGFVRLPDSLRLVLPMHTIQSLLEP